MTSRSAVASSLVALIALTAGAETGPKVLNARPLVNLPETVQTFDPDNFQLSVVLEKGLVKADGGGSDVLLDLTRADGKWTTCTARTPRYNSATHDVDPSGLKVTRESLQGDVKITLKPDRWVPADGSTGSMTCTLQGKLTAVKVKDAKEPVPPQFWLIKPKSQSAVMALQGSFTSAFEGNEGKGRAEGTFQLPIRDGKWNMGHPAGDAVQLDFDLGDERVNWNFVRLAILQLPRPADLRKHSGLRISVATDKPRTDAAVSVWLQEADGSWYYLRDAVPLIDKANQAVVLFEDFVEAEWVAPGSHMDEDYVLDLSGIA